ncbi:MAG: argininosuccinate lyase [Gemmataceae bacterium]
MSEKTWGGRFERPTSRNVELFTESISVDRRLYPYDILASEAHARMLAHVGLLTAEESQRICDALSEIRKQIDEDSFKFSAAQEDIHTHIEQALIAELGELGRKLHAGRSRNDQVATAMRLWMREAIDEIDQTLKSVQSAFVEMATRERDVVIPGYTHLQRAQPVLAAHQFLAYVEKFQRDRDRLIDCGKRANVSPLGAAALAGTSLPIDRQFMAGQLGFSDIARNSMDAASDRDFVLEYVCALATIAIHLSGWAEEWIIWSSTEFSFLELADEVCTGSSFMPHKKNPDVVELIRGKSARVIGALNSLMVLFKSLPLAYNRDLQEDKVALFEAHDTVASCLTMASEVIRSSKMRRESIAATLDAGFLDATTLMEFLITQGTPMRSAHEAVGRLVRSGEQRGCGLADLPPEVFESVLPGVGRAVYEMLGVPRALAAFRSFGSTAPAEVEQQIAFWRGRLGIS